MNYPELEDGLFVTHRTLLQTPRINPATVPDRLDRLDAERDIQDTLHAYCVFYDAADVEGVVDVFTADATLSNIVGTFKGSQEIRDHFVFMTSNVVHAAHVTLNAVIRLDSIDRARSASYLYAIGARQDMDIRGTAGTYSDVLVRESDGKWRISERRITADLSFTLHE